jgi:Ser/Thr protein kinase RdoA (MazF antagonist)
MATVAVSSSILTASALIPLLQQQYGLSVNHCRIIKAGVNHTYLVTTADTRYVFRIYSHNWRSDKEIGEELRLILHLKEKGCSVSHPIADAQGQYIQQLQAPEGQRQAVLFSYAPGNKLPQLEPAQHEAIGRLMAQIHRNTEGFALERCTYTPAYLLEEPLQLLADFLSPDCAEMQFLQTAATNIRNVMEQADPTQLRQGAVHLDIWFDNMSVTPEGEITIFDFDFCGNGGLYLDIAYYILQLYTTEPQEQAYQSKLAAFMQGYESVTPLSDEERRLALLVSPGLFIFYLGVQCRRFDDWSNVFLNEAYLRRFIEVRIRKWYDYVQTSSQALPKAG